MLIGMRELLLSDMVVVVLVDFCNKEVVDSTFASVPLM